MLVVGGRVAEMRMPTDTGITKSDAGGLSTAAEISAQLTPGAILLPD